LSPLFQFCIACNAIAQVEGKADASFVIQILNWYDVSYVAVKSKYAYCFCTVQSSTEVSTLADDYSSTVSVSDKVVLSAESAVASQKASSSDSHQPVSWHTAEDRAAGGRHASPSKLHLISDVDSEGTRTCLLLFCALWVYFV